MGLVGFSYNSRMLFRLAREALARISTESADTTPAQHDALAAIVFSAATLEAAIEELALTARLGSKAKSMPPYLQTLASGLELVEEGRGSVRLKYDLALLIATGTTFDRSSQPYQDFADLVSLRDSVVHLSPAFVSPAPTKLERRLRAKGICAQREVNELADWVRCVSTRGVAMWACGVPRRVGDVFVQSATDSQSELFMNLVWGSGLDLQNPY
jgi:hypothetical protein